MVKQIWQLFMDGAWSMCRGTYRFLDDSGRISLSGIIHLCFIIIFIIVLSDGTIYREYLHRSGGFETKEKLAKSSQWFGCVPKTGNIALIRTCQTVCTDYVKSALVFDWSVYFESVVHVPKSLQIGFVFMIMMIATGAF